MKNVIALGFFDGIHLGHAALLQAARRRAEEYKATACLLTFDSHPDTFVFGQTPPLINTQTDRAEIAKLYGIERIIITHFDEQVMHMPWESFVEQIILTQNQAVYVVCGHDFRFGDRGAGTAELLQKKCRELGIGCDIVQKVTIDGEIVSSTKIRQLLQNGEIEQANRFLAHPHRLSGIVRSGRQLGRTLGIPTANLVIPEGIVVPKFGVYATKVHVGNQIFPAVTNIGTRPTVNGHHVTVESWLLDFEGNLYDQTITVEFIAYLRPEQKFPSLDALKAEIQHNAQQVRDMIKNDTLRFELLPVKRTVKK